jgi:HTH-type transcriptional regulator / antitoxin HigA
MTEPFDPDWVVAPGETLAEWFESIGLPKSVARQYGIPDEQLEKILAGEEPIDEALAQRLCNLTFVGAPFWLNMEHNYRVGLAAGKRRT